jgi:PAS domain S-box-containing protein
MPEPLSYKELEKLVKDLKSEKQLLSDELFQREKLFQSKETVLQQIINDTSEGILVLQRDEIKLVNQTALQLLAYQHNDIFEVKFTDLIHADFKGQVIQYISEIAEAKKAESWLELKMLTQTGQSLSVKIRGRKIVFHNNQSAIKIKFENIQEINTKEKEIGNLRNAVDFFENHMSEGIFLLSNLQKNDKSLFSYKVEDVNQAALSILGKTQANVLDQKLGELMIPDYIYQLPGSYDTSFNDEFELYITNLKKYVQFSVFAVSTHKLACKIVDITDCFLTKQQLNKNLQRNELFTEILSIYNSIYTYDEKYKLVIDRIAYHFKPKRIFIIRNNEQHKTGKLVIQYVTKEFEPLPADFKIQFDRIPSWNKLLMERKMILGFTLQYLPEDLQVYLKSIQMKGAYIFPIFIDSVLYGSIVFENLDKTEWDNTEINYLKMVSVLIASLISRQNYEENLLKSKEKAEEADRLKSSFLANMSYDIRIPMTAIIGFSDLLADPDLTIGEREEFIELISKSGQDLLTLIDNIVDVAKIETGQLRISSDDCTLDGLFKELYQTQVRNPKVVERDDLDLIIDLDEKFKNIPFKTDVFRFKQIMNNLIDNAIKFTERGQIHFGISNVWQDTIEFYVQDTGIGIAEETQYIVFERFSKIDRSYTKEYNGTGLGLAISKSLVELMGGDIRVISFPGKGSTFYFTHPLPQKAGQQIENEPKKIVSAYNWSTKTILVAEDVEQNYKFLEFTLIPTQVKIVWAKNGKEAVDYVQEGKPVDLILMDIRMPIMNGIDATKAIIRIKQVPVIAQTAYTLGDEKDLAMNAGCSHYMTKPIHAPKLLELINNEIFKS